MLPSDLYINLVNPGGQAEKCLRTLTECKSTAEAVRSIDVRWIGPMTQELQDLIVKSLEHTTRLSALSLVNCSIPAPNPLFRTTVPPNFLPELSSINIDTLDALVQLVPHRPVQKVALEEKIDVDSIHRVADALRLSTSTVQHLKLNITVSCEDDVFQISSKLGADEVFQHLVTLDLQWYWDLDEGQHWDAVRVIFCFTQARQQPDIPFSST
jgi:hypothetical protein